jgi:hypothetical protein
MGSSNWNSHSYASYRGQVASKSQQQIFTNTSGCHPDLDPSKFAIRESVDSKANPASTPVIVGVDETGSMGYLATQIIKEGLGVIVEGIIDRKPITDPHILLAALGDAYVDSSPIQVTQFEADTVITEQIEKFYIEGNGGGNGGESYSLLWWFAVNKTHCDSINTRKRKGYLFTIGDESCHPELTRDQINKLMAGNVEVSLSATDILAECQKQWNVFHLITPSSATKYQNAIQRWRELLGERAIVVDDWKKLGQIIVSIMQVNEGHDKNKIMKSWDDETNVIVASAVSQLAPQSVDQSADTEIAEI